MKIRGLFLMVLAVVCFGAMSSCVNDEIGKTDPDAPDGRGYLSAGVNVNPGTAVRAAGPDNGIPAEGRVRSVRVILFANTKQVVSMAEYFVYHDGADWTKVERNAAVEVMPKGTTFSFSIEGTEADPTINFHWEQLPIRAYRLAVLVNAGGANLEGEPESGRMLDAIIPAGGNMSLYKTLNDPEKTYDALVDPTPLYTAADVSEYAGGTYNFGGFRKSMAGLTNINMFFDSTTDEGVGPGSTDDILIYMSNADRSSAAGSADNFYNITAAQVKPTLAAAQTARLTVNVERAVAKVAVFNETGYPQTADEQAIYYTTPDGDKISNITWGCDVLNMHTYLMRKPAKALSGDEAAGTPAANRYATSPYMNGISWEKPGSAKDKNPVEYYFSLNAATDGRTFGDIIFREWNDMEASEPSTDWATWLYVPENTFDAADQYEDVTTRILVRLNYVPGADNYVAVGDLPAGYDGDGSSDPGITFNDSYFTWNGVIFTVDAMRRLYDMNYGLYDGNGNVEAPVPVDDMKVLVGLMETFDELNDLYDADNGSAPSDFDGLLQWFAGLPVPALNGFSYYEGGVSTYVLLVPHFDHATQQPGPMAYGRYGVVRNNVYKLKITGVTGPGKPGIPVPEGPDDKDPVNIQAAFYVSTWTSVPLVYDL